MKNKLLIIDGNSLMYRAYYATAFNSDQILKTSEGVPTNAVLTFFNMLLAAINKIKPSNIHIAFDAGKKTFRHEDYSEYKGGRKPTPEELILQFPVLKELLTKLGISHSELVNYEADDIIASLATKYKNELEINILTSDRDLLQMVSENVKVVFNKKGVKILDEYNIDNFYEKLGFYPEQTIDYKSLVGDPSDNIKGVPGIGPKSAVKLLAKYNNIENIISHISELPKKQEEKFAICGDKLLVWKKIITLITELEIEDKLSDMPGHFVPHDDLNIFLEKYELRSIVSKLSFLNENNSKNIISNINKKLIKNDNKILRNIIFFQLILDSDNYHIGKPLAAAIYFRGEFHYYDNALDEELLEILKLNNKKILFNSKKIMRYYDLNNIKINNIQDDIQLIYYLLNPNIENSLYEVCKSNEITIFKRSEFLTKTYIKKVKKNLSDLIEYELKGMYLIYFNGIDKLWEMELNNIYENIEKPYQKILFDMESKGVMIDLDFLNTFKIKINKLINNCKKNIFKLINNKINLNSPLQLKELIYKTLHIVKKGKLDTSIESLSEIKDQHPLIPLLIEYRKWEKLESTYINSLLKFQKNEVINTIFLQTKTETGRLSSVFPNMQNISTHNIDQKEIKKAFISRPGYSFIFADYSQIELRILAHLSESPKYIEVFKNNIDIHKETASKIFNVDIDYVTNDMRYKAKSVNFGIMYGMTSFGLAKQLGIPNYKAQELIENYNYQYPDLKEFQDKSIKKAFNNKMIKTAFGRIRLLPSNYLKRVGFAKRIAVNTPIQGTAADIIKIASIEVIKAINPKICSLLLQIHDELVFEVKDEYVEKYKILIKKTMENSVNFKVPFLVNLRTAKNWFY